MKKLMIVVAIFALTACASHGTRFDMADVEAMQPGVTTYDEAVQKLGKPKAQNFAEDGSKSVTWVWAMAGLGVVKSRATRILFDKDGKMIRVASKVE